MARTKLKKGNSIIHLIDHLNSMFGFAKYILNDFWQADRCAIGLSNPRNEALIYISTYNGKNGLYFVSSEDIKDPTLSTEKYLKLKEKKGNV